jgi:16S rRNA (guanine1207-N2)-methyltransferase
MPDLRAKLTADRGVFSGSRIDPGTSELLRAGAPGGPAWRHATGEILDLGCGYGPIAVALGTRHRSARVWAVDVNSRALELTASNAAALDLANVVAAHPDEVPGGVAFEQIWSNPPIRIGKQALQAMLSRWLGHLGEGGTAWMVVHRHLGADSLGSWLGAEGWRVERLRSKRGYRILEVSR